MYHDPVGKLLEGPRKPKKAKSASQFETAPRGLESCGRKSPPVPTASVDSKKSAEDFEKEVQDWFSREGNQREKDRQDMKDEVDVPGFTITIVYGWLGWLPSGRTRKP